MGLVATVGMLAVVPSAFAAPTPLVYSGVGTGTGPGSAAAARSAFEAALGGADNGTQPGPITGGYRVLDWSGDVVPLGPGWFSGSTVTYTVHLGADSVQGQPQVGLGLATPGSAVAMSIDGFLGFNPSYPALFQSAGTSTLFAPVGSTETDLTFSVPSAPDPPLVTPQPPGPFSGNVDAALPGAQASVGGFGATFLNVELSDSSSIEFFAGDGSSIGTYDVPAGAPGEPEFLGVLFGAAPVVNAKISSPGTRRSVRLIRLRLARVRTSSCLRTWSCPSRSTVRV